MLGRAMGSSTALGCRLVVVVAVLSCLFGCGEPVRSDRPHDDRPWPAGAWVGQRRPFDLSQKEPALLELPWAGNPGPDVDLIDPSRSRLRLVVNLEAKRVLMFKGKRWRFDPESRSVALESVGREVAALSRSRVDGSEATTALLRCDYRAPWADVRDLLTALRTPPASIGRLQFSIASSDETSWMDARIDADAIDVEPTTFQFQIIMIRSPGSSAEAPRLLIHQSAFSFAPGDPYAEGDASELANESWRSFRTMLRASPEHHSAAVKIDDTVPWAHVAMTFGMLVEAGVVNVSVHGVGAFHLSTPPSRPKNAWKLGDRDPRDWSPGFALGVGAAIALAVFGLGALTGRRRARQRASVSEIR